MVVDVGVVKNHIKPKADSTLNNMRKADLIKYIRTLEHNYNVAVSFNNQQAKNIELLMPKWIPVTERLPDEKKIIDGEIYYRNVAVRVKNLLHERVAYYDPEHECWYDTGFFQIRGVTHWAKLPAWGE